jgi:hypothetical protein
MLKCWRDIPEYKQFVVDTWQSLHVDGWGGYVLKENLKLLKTALKDWHVNHSTNVPGIIDSLKARSAKLDGKGEDVGLLEDEVSELHEVMSAIHSMPRMHTSIQWQQLRLLWLRDKYYHSLLKSRRRRNALSSILVNGQRLEGVQAVYAHFSSHFRAVTSDRSRVDNLQFSTLTHMEDGSLVRPFSVEDVHDAM